LLLFFSLLFKNEKILLKDRFEKITFYITN